MKFIRYREGYKYQLAEDFVYLSAIRVPEAVGNRWIVLAPSGAMVIKEGYAWDGPSGPTFDSKSFMRGSLVHDALYQLMREGLLPASCRQAADEELRKVCEEDGMWGLRAWCVYHGVRFGGAGAIDPRPNEMLTAP